MKTNKNFIPVIFVALIFFGCGKEKQILQDNAITMTNNSFNALRINTNAMEDSMNAFIDESRQTTPSFHNYEAQDALLVVEAALNCRTCSPDSLYDDTKADTLIFTKYAVKDAKGEFIFSGTKMNSLWSVIFDSTLNAENRVQFDSAVNPFNIVVDLELISFNDASSSDSQLVKIQVVTLVGNVIYPIPWDCEYGSNDFYNAFWQSLTPGCSTNTSTTSNCFKQMTRKLHPYCRGWCDPYCYFSYVGQLPSGFYGAMPSNLVTCTQTDWLYYTTNYSNYMHCLSPSEMECYTNNVFKGGEYYAPPGKCVIAYTFQENIPICSCPVYQSCNPWYGKPTMCN